MRYYEQMMGCTGTMACPRPLTSIEYHTADCEAWWVKGAQVTSGWVRLLKQYALPDDDDIEDIVNVAKTHSRCRVTVETWEKR